MNGSLTSFLSQVRNKGTVTLDAREDSGGKMQTRYLIVEVIISCKSLNVSQSICCQVDDLLRNTVVVVDNRGAMWTQGAALGDGGST